MRSFEEAGLSDSQIIQQSFSFPEAFAALFDRHAGAIHRFVSKQVGHSASEDLVAETFTTAFWVRERFDLDQSDARPWLFGIATNVFRHYWRSESRRIRREAITPIEQPSDDPAEEASANVFFQSHSEPIARALAQLDQPSVEVLLLIAGPGFTYEEVATALDIPVGTVRSRLARARRKLRELLDESGQYLDDGEPSNQPISTTEGPT